MSEYSVEKNNATYIVKKQGISLLSVPNYSDALMFASTLETETAPLRAQLAEKDEEIATLQAALEAQSQKIAELSSNYANLYAENIELKRIAEGLAELEDIAADLADNLPGDKTTVNAVEKEQE